MLTFRDFLYGEIVFPDADLKLFQTPEMSRLRQLSLSAVPDFLTPTSICATKFDHTLGVLYLSRSIRGYRKLDNFRDIYFAAMAHDLGTPPFSHLSEHFLKQIYNVDHEQFAREIIIDSAFAAEVKNQGGDIERICNLITGQEKPLGALINGTIDLDNLDNSLRYGLSKGIIREAPYSPTKLAAGFIIRPDQILLSSVIRPEINGWKKCRRAVYDFVYSSANLAGGMMLFRAIGLAARADKIKLPFFKMTDSEAFRYLLEKTDSKVRRLVDRAYRWQFYEQVYDCRKTHERVEAQNLIQCFDARMMLADELSDLLQIPPEDICVYIGRDKGFKRIDLPMLGQNGMTIDYDFDGAQNNEILKPSWSSQVYLNPRWAEHAYIAKIKEYMDTKTGLDYVTGF